MIYLNLFFVQWRNWTFSRGLCRRNFLFYIYGVCKSIQVFIFCCNICVVGKGCTEKFIENPNIRNHKEVKSARDPIVGPPDRPGNRVHCPAPEKFIENPNIR